MKTLELFNAVIAKQTVVDTPFISDSGFVITPGALWASDKIIDYYHREQLNGNDLNKTFHKSWEVIKTSPRYVLYLKQIQHYMSTYGSDFKDEIYIPDEVLDLPNVKLKYKVIRAYTEAEMLEKCLGLLQSGVALKEETINDLFVIIVDDLGYTFTGNEGIRNKEAIVKIADIYGILPNDIMEFFRYIIYKTTGESLLIKNNETIDAIKNSNFNPAPMFNQFGLNKLAEIFNRFKPLFLAFKSKCPRTINIISKLSKTCHKPLVQNPLNNVTNELLTTDKHHWLDNATPFALFSALSTCHVRMNGQDSFVYRIRNGKSWTMAKEVKASIAKDNFFILQNYLIKRFDLSKYKIFIPKDVKYALPTSEKMFIGNIPTGTQFVGKKLAVGIYWEDDWGACDLDLSGINIGGKVGWNAAYNQGDANLMFSGDITSAPDGAVEYLYARKGLNEPTLVHNNVYDGDSKSGYRIIIGKGDNISKDYMMNPNNLLVDIKTKSVQKQTILGLFLPKKEKQSFVLLNLGAGNLNVSGYSDLTEIGIKALYQQWQKAIRFKYLVKLLGATIVDTVDESNVNLSLDNLEKDSFIKLF